MPIGGSGGGPPPNIMMTDQVLNAIKLASGLNADGSITDGTKNYHAYIVKNDEWTAKLTLVSTEPAGGRRFRITQAFWTLCRTTGSSVDNGHLKINGTQYTLWPERFAIDSNYYYRTATTVV